MSQISSCNNADYRSYSITVAKLITSATSVIMTRNVMVTKFKVHMRVKVKAIERAASGLIEIL